VSLSEPSKKRALPTQYTAKAQPLFFANGSNKKHSQRGQVEE